MIRRVVLTGLSGTGKSTVTRLIAADLGWSAFDTDAEIERRSGMTIPAIFRDLGEADFRARERSVLRQGLGLDNVVIATGGGAVIEADVWSGDLLGHPDTLVVWLDAESSVLVDRLWAQSRADGATASRPLLLEGDPLQRLDAMRARRSSAYGRADVTIPVDHDEPSSIAGDIAAIVRLDHGEPAHIELKTPAATSTISVGGRAVDALPGIIHSGWPKARQIWIGVDEHVLPHVEADLAILARMAPPEIRRTAIPAGESSKSLEGLGRLFDWMLLGGVERSDAAVALGGGVVGDLVGLAGATVLRGIGLIQIPTTLLAMVDSSVGGKTGINHPAGKNLIGAFLQPRHVLIDPALLNSLPPRVYAAGWAEIIKHAVIQPSTPGGRSGHLMRLLERNSVALARPGSPILPLIIRENVALKAAVVMADERESGLRAILNFGHTIGHGVEAATPGLPHGEAVAVGMCAALQIAREMGRIESATESRVRDLIAAFGLPVAAAFDPDLVRLKMQSDKKKSAGVQQWVLPVRGGGVTIETDVPDETIERALEAIVLS
jgi:3-dehydroquinate synthase